MMKVITMYNNEQFFLEIFFNALNQNNIDYAVLRNYDYLPVSMNGSDMDILINKNCIDIFYETLDKIILPQCCGSIITRYGKYAPRLCVLFKYKKIWGGIQLDIHEGCLPYKKYDMYNSEKLLKNKIAIKGILVANPIDGLLISFLKEILHNKNCNKEKYYDPLQNCYKNSRKYYLEVLAFHYPENFIILFQTIMENGYSAKLIEKLACYGRKALGCKPWKFFDSFFRKINGLKRLFNPPGYCIAFLGCDGAGKSSVINSINKPLSEAMHRKIYYNHMRPNLIPNIAQLLGKKREANSTDNPHGTESSGSAGSVLRFFYYVFDYIAGYWIKTYTNMMKSSCIYIFDRYYYDYIIDQKRSRIKLPIILIKIVGFFVPKPDLIFCLGAEPEKIQHRKPELSLPEITRQVESLKELCLSKSNMVWVDTGISIEISSDYILTEITKKMASRYVGN